MTQLNIDWNISYNPGGLLIKTDGSVEGSGPNIFIDITPNMKASIIANPNMDSESFCYILPNQKNTLRNIIKTYKSPTIGVNSPNGLFELAVNIALGT